MQNNNNTNKGRSYTSNKSYNSTNAPELEQKPTYLSGLFKPPSDPTEAEIERAKLHGRIPNNTHNSATFTA